MTDATKQKISAANKGRMFSDSHRAAISRAKRGVKIGSFSEVARKNMSLARLRIGSRPPRMGREGYKFWKERPSEYISLHAWIRKEYSTPNQCEACGTEATGRFMHWANVSGDYKKEREDWERLCAKCHRQKDIKNLHILP